MIKEVFNLFADEDEDQASYDNKIINYNLNHITENIEDLITHEWIHALIDISSDVKTTMKQDHYIMKVINFE